LRRAAMVLAILLGLSGGGASVSIGAPSGWRVVAPTGRIWGAVAATQPEILAKAPAMRTLTGEIADFPVFPGARASAQPMRSYGLIPGSSYTIDLSREWRVPAGMLMVRDALTQAAGQRGWVAGGGSVLGHVRTPLVAEGYGLGFTRSRTAQLPEIDVSLLPPAGGVALLPSLSPPDRGPTLIRYDAVTIWTPPRPAASLAPKHIARVDLTVWSGGVALYPRHLLTQASIGYWKTHIRSGIVMSVGSATQRRRRGCPGCRACGERRPNPRRGRPPMERWRNPPL